MSHDGNLGYNSHDKSHDSTGSHIMISLLKTHLILQI